MKLSLSLIQSFIDLDLPAEKIGEVLTLLGIEVDRIEKTESGGPLFELSLTPNLGHCMSALGIARELSASLQIPLKKREISSFPKTALSLQVAVSDSSLCPRYMCCEIEGVQAGPSPAWLKEELEASGQKSINFIVDIANYVMVKWGQPLHAFDLDLLEGGKVEVSASRQAQSFLGLDGVEREIPAGTLLISDAKKPIAIAGIMGGANSAVSEKTTRILLEAACFDPLLIRIGSKKIGLRTESSHRFEKGVDPIGVEMALFEAAKLMGGRVKGSIDLATPFKSKEIHYRVSRINQILGTHLSESEIEGIFTRLGLIATGGKAQIPSYRNDLSEEIDLVEEVARIYGYNHIQKSIPRSATSTTPHDSAFLFENEMRRRLTALGLTEFLSCDLISPKLAEISRSIAPELTAFLQAKASKSEEYSVLRTSLLPSLLQAVHRNLAQKTTTLSVFEMGRIHFLQGEKPVEIPMIGVLLTGKRGPSHWSHKLSDFDYFDLKGMIENLLQGVYLPSQHVAFHPGRQADVHMGDLIVGSLGEIHPNLLEKFDIGQRVFYAEFNLLSLLQKKKPHLKVAPLSQFPSSERDWTIPLPLNMPIDQVFQAIASLKVPLLDQERIELVDLYIPEKAEQKNATFSFLYRDQAKTVSSEEVDAAHQEVIQAVTKLLAK